MDTVHRNQISVVFDNVSYSPSMIAKWGYSCIIALNSGTVLFDTGSNGELLLANMKLMSLNPGEIDTVIISHDHWDHTGGLDAFLNVNQNVIVYVPRSLSRQTTTIIREHGAKMERIHTAMPISKGIYSLGEMESAIIPEQSIVIPTSKGLVVLTGCAHPGIVNIIRRAKQEFPKENIYLAMGGFHLKDHRADEINGIVTEMKRLGVQFVAPSHCTGDAGLAAFEKVYQDKRFQSGVGQQIRI